MLSSSEVIESEEKFKDQVLLAIWSIGALVPILVLAVQQGNTQLFKSILISFTLTGFGSIICHKLFNIPTKPLGLITIMLFNFGLAAIVIEAPISYGTTHLWFPVALTLSIFLSGLKAGFFTMVFFEIVNVYNHQLKINLGVDLPPSWSIEKLQETMFIDRTFSIITFFVFLFLLIISKQRIYESLLKAKEGIFKSSKLSEVGKVAGNIAHEINSPLTVITLATNLIEKELKKESINKELIQKHTEKIQQATEKMDAIIRGMKKMSRDGSTDPFVDIQLSSLFKEVEDFFQHKTKLQGIELTFKGLDQDIYLFGQWTQLSQIFINIINNAIDAIEDSSEKWIRVEVEHHHDSVIIMIVDSGAGVPKDHEDKIFEPLFTTKSADKGTGLGLSIVHSLVEQHQGSLIVDRRFSDSRFTLNFPKKIKQAA